MDVFAASVATPKCQKSAASAFPTVVCAACSCRALVACVAAFSVALLLDIGAPSFFGAGCVSAFGAVSCVSSGPASGVLFLVVLMCVRRAWAMVSFRCACCQHIGCPGVLQVSRVLSAVCASTTASACFFSVLPAYALDHFAVIFPSVPPLCVISTRPLANVIVSWPDVIPRPCLFEPTLLSSWHSVFPVISAAMLLSVLCLVISSSSSPMFVASNAILSPVTFGASPNSFGHTFFRCSVRPASSFEAHVSPFVLSR
ncbi:hypothetical protein, conserved in T. vivax [Trypanosoma vivax Y486]|uniref:Uncharacterized protein n=1 Tax=Trypanosoma vivax (strain Y486) TaxID=1055687 RepID=F9WPT2_TRYVY|nr:hypothetical protein, conserved in T. vivax [Trypanosoma vivax Y486]|eukprot:CCD19559.1 hypothetical protein, conserved in T. vivax [Trypanosoma vivax Y486]